MVKPLLKFSIGRMQILKGSIGICLVMLVMSSLTPSLADSLVKAVHPSATPALITPSYEEYPELYPPYDSYIHINPPAPTPDDMIQITVGGWWPNSCTPRYQFHEIVGNEIRIYAAPCVICDCLQVIMPFSFTVEVDPLPKGFYIVRVYGVGSKSFFVSPEQLYLPVILRSY